MAKQAADDDAVGNCAPISVVALLIGGSTLGYLLREKVCENSICLVRQKTNLAI